MRDAGRNAANALQSNQARIIAQANANGWAGGWRRAGILIARRGFETCNAYADYSHGEHTQGERIKAHTQESTGEKMKSVKKWAIQNRAGYLFAFTDKRADSIQAVTHPAGANVMDWKEFKRDGFSVVRVNVEIIKPKARKLAHAASK